MPKVFLTMRNLVMAKLTADSNNQHTSKLADTNLKNKLSTVLVLFFFSQAVPCYVVTG